MHLYDIHCSLDICSISDPCVYMRITFYSICCYSGVVLATTLLIWLFQVRKLVDSYSALLALKKKQSSQVQATGHDSGSNSTLDESKQADEDLNSSGDEGEEDCGRITIPASMRHNCKYDKRYCCLYCNGMYSVKLSRYLGTVHKAETDGQDILAMPKGSPQREARQSRLEKKGAYSHNLKVLQDKEGSLLVMKRPSAGQEVCSNDYSALLNVYVLNVLSSTIETSYAYT